MRGLGTNRWVGGGGAEGRCGAVVQACRVLWWAGSRLQRGRWLRHAVSQACGPRPLLSARQSAGPHAARPRLARRTRWATRSCARTRRGRLMGSCTTVGASLGAGRVAGGREGGCQLAAAGVQRLAMSPFDTHRFRHAGTAFPLSSLIPLARLLTCLVLLLFITPTAAPQTWSLPAPRFTTCAPSPSTRARSTPCLSSRPRGCVPSEQYISCVCRCGVWPLAAVGAVGAEAGPCGVHSRVWRTTPARASPQPAACCPRARPSLAARRCSRRTKPRCATSAQPSKTWQGREGPLPALQRERAAVRLGRSPTAEPGALHPWPQPQCICERTAVLSLPAARRAGQFCVSPVTDHSRRALLRCMHWGCTSTSAHAWG